MNGIMKRGLITLAVTGGLVVLGAGAAHADDGTDGDDSLLGGLLGDLGVNVPVNVNGNGISIIGNSSSSGSSGGGGGGSSSSGGSTSGNNSLLGGTQGLIGVDVPVTISGNAVSVLGDSASEESSFGGASGTGQAGTASTSGKEGILGGTQVLGTVSVPVTVGGNAISVLGDSSSSDSSSVAGASGSGSSAAGSTSGEDSVAGGSQVLGDVTVPVTVGGNAISVLGDSSSNGAAVTPGTSGSGSGSGATTGGSDSTLGGTQVVTDAGVPVTVGGNAISVVGDSSSTDAAVTPGSTGGTGGTPSTSGDDGILGGTQVVTPIDVPVTVGGNAISVVGDSTTGGSTTGGGDPTDPGDVGGETITPSGTQPAAVGGVSLLAATGSGLLMPGIAFAVLLLAAGATALMRLRLAQR